MAAPEFERSGPSALRRDGHYGSGSGGNTFTVLADSTKQYVVRVYVGDATYPRDQIEVTVEGAAPYTIGSLAAGSYDARVTTAGSSASSDGKLTVTIRDRGGDPYWVINGIDVWEATATPPVQALRAGKSPESRVPQSPESRVESPEPEVEGQESEVTLSPSHLVTLSSAQLAPVVEQAIGLWSETGLTREQVALLRSTPVIVGDLDAQGYLGMTTPERIVIDDDGVGLGWYLDREWPPASASGSGLSTLDSRPSYDLLTVVLHEMGHVSGHEHDKAADDLMADVLQPGVRRLPDVDAVFAKW